jgi:hypothetical protein
MCHVLLAAVNGGKQNSSNQMYDFRIFNSEIISQKKEFGKHEKGSRHYR